MIAGVSFQVSADSHRGISGSGIGRSALGHRHQVPVADSRTAGIRTPDSYARHLSPDYDISRRIFPVSGLPCCSISFPQGRVV